MTYRADLSKDASTNAIYVGWLDPDHQFNEGVSSPEFIEKLLLHYSYRVRQTRGFHVCQFCKESRFGIPVDINRQTVTLGSAEVEIEDPHGRVYAAPDLLYHYITEHRYAPPSEFVNAVTLADPKSHSAGRTRFRRRPVPR